jgi:hypothetical protein
MSIEYQKTRAVFHEEVGVDEAEDLLQWLQRTPDARIDLSACAHLHPANVQVLMASGAAVVAWPGTPGWRIWLESALRPSEGGR